LTTNQTPQNRAAVQKPTSGFQGIQQEFLSGSGALERRKVNSRCIIKERPASEGRGCDVAPPPLRYAVQGLRSATAALGSNCCGVRGGKNCRRT
jgi:hypothetical protein